MALRALLFPLLLLASVEAGEVADWIARHRETMGGAANLAALQSLRAEGTVQAGGAAVRFHLLAARPAAVRVETERGGRTLVQATDGIEPPWEFDTGQWPPTYRAMVPAAARVFAADAEFDNPLVAGPDRGYILEDGGEVQLEGRRWRRILATRRLVETVFLFLDPETAWLALRLEEKAGPGGRKVRILTRYEDPRSVAGVLLPHRVVQVVDGVVRQTTVIARMEANPGLESGLFTRPRPPAEAR
jgi:hypothetical protein